MIELARLASIFVLALSLGLIGRRLGIQDSAILLAIVFSGLGLIASTGWPR